MTSSLSKLSSSAALALVLVALSFPAQAMYGDYVINDAPVAIDLDGLDAPVNSRVQQADDTVVIGGEDTFFEPAIIPAPTSSVETFDAASIGAAPTRVTPAPLSRQAEITTEVIAPPVPPAVAVKAPPVAPPAAAPVSAAEELTRREITPPPAARTMSTAANINTHPIEVTPLSETVPLTTGNEQTGNISFSSYTPPAVFLSPSNKAPVKASTNTEFVPVAVENDAVGEEKSENFYQPSQRVFKPSKKTDQPVITFREQEPVTQSRVQETLVELPPAQIISSAGLSPADNAVLTEDTTPFKQVETMPVPEPAPVPVKAAVKKSAPLQDRTPVSTPRLYNRSRQPVTAGRPQLKNPAVLGIANKPYEPQKRQSAIDRAMQALVPGMRKTVVEDRIPSAPVPPPVAPVFRPSAFKKDAPAPVAESAVTETDTADNIVPPPQDAAPAPSAPPVVTLSTETEVPAAPAKAESSAVPAPAEETVAQPQKTFQEFMVNFAISDGSLSAEGKSALMARLDDLKKAEDTRIKVAAYASANPDDAQGARRVSLSRALAIRSFLMENGIKASRIDVRALGSDTQMEPFDRADISVVTK